MEDNDSGIETVVELVNTTDNEDFREPTTLAHTRGCVILEGASVIVCSAYRVKVDKRITESKI